jgi:hypothetical protein
MSRNIEEAFNDCFERLLSGESLESCLRSYPEYAADLNIMLNSAFDVKRKSFPIQPRPEFKYWSRARMQGILYTTKETPVKSGIGFFNLHRNMSIAMAALLVFLIASSGTAAASADALPDQTLLYPVKLAVEQVEVTLTPFTLDKAELHANLAEKRANEIAVMASKGKTDEVVTTIARMNYQLDQAEQLINKSETEETSPSIPWIINPPAPAVSTTPAPITESPAASVGAATTTSITEQITENNTEANTLPNIEPPASDVKPFSASLIKPPENTVLSSNSTEDQGLGQVQGQEQGTSKKITAKSARSIAAVRKAKTSIKATTANTVNILENALNSAPDSVKSKLSATVEQTRRTSQRFNNDDPSDDNSKTIPQEQGTVDNVTDNQSQINSHIKPVRSHGKVNSSLNTADNSTNNNSGTAQTLTDNTTEINPTVVDNSTNPDTSSSASENKTRYWPIYPFKTITKSVNSSLNSIDNTSGTYTR